MKKKKLKKLTKDQLQIQALTKQLSDLESSLRSANYRETDLTRKLQAAEKTAEENKRLSTSYSDKLSQFHQEIQNVANSLFSVKANIGDVTALQRIVGYAEGRLDAAVSTLSGYRTSRSHIDAMVTDLCSPDNSTYRRGTL